MELVTLKETSKSRIYNFIELDEIRRVIIHKQMEYRNGKIFVRAKVRPVSA